MTLRQPMKSYLPKKGPQFTRDPVDESCPVCDQREWVYLMSPHGLRYFACPHCDLVRISPHPTAEECKKIYQSSESHRFELAEATSTLTERANTFWCTLKSAFPPQKAAESKILLFASDSGLLLDTGRRIGFRNIILISDDGIDNAGTKDTFDAAVVIFSLERNANPKSALRRVHNLLRTGGTLLLVAPMLDSWPARFLKDSWTELRPENLYHFNSHNIQSFLLDCGFREIVLKPDRPFYTLHHIYYRACMYPKTLFTRAVRRSIGLLPVNIMRRVRMRGPSSATIVKCKKVDLPSRKTLSIVMPAYNEHKTFRECFDRVLAKQVPGLDKEIIVVESNSTDGTREMVKTLCNRPGIKLILQDRPKGKGNAVREGLRAATGDIILIQDADLEYDVEDYDALAHPILNNQAAFVLGSRHAGNWKMRQFNEQKVSAFYFNFGHQFFRGLMNLLFRQSMKDPFTMYKVFRSDCLYGLKLECDRFDFDIEIVIKLVRKGYRPMEVPVNYRARSFKEGKKVGVFHDPLTWLRAIAKYRCCRVASFLYEEGVRRI